MTEPLPPELAKLIAAERAAPVASQAVRALVKAKLTASIAGAPLGAAAAGATAAGVGKILATIALVVGAGTVAVVKTTQHHAAPVPHREPPPVARAVAPPAAIEVAPDPAPPRAVDVRAPVTPSARPTKVSKPVPVPSQVDLLQQAWAELSRGDAAKAYELATQDASVHADGPLAEERDALLILSLTKLGHRDEAAAANERFATKYPASIHRDAIARALTGGS